MNETRAGFPSAGERIRLLILKDVHLYYRLSLGALGFGAMALFLLADPKGTRLYMGGVLLVTVLIALGAATAFLTVIEERQKQTQPFVLSLPISPGQHALGKIFANALLFGVPWSLLVLAIVALILHHPDLPDGAVAPTIIVATEIVLSTSLILTVAMVSQSLAWTIAVTILGNVLFNGFVFLIFNTPAFAGATESQEITWSPAALQMLGVEIVGIVLLCGLAYAVASRRKDFL